MIHFLSTDNRQRSTVFVQIVNLLFSDVSTTYYLFSLVSSTRLYHNFQFSIFNLKISVVLLTVAQSDVHSVVTGIINNKGGVIRCREDILSVDIDTVGILDDDMRYSHIIIKGDG